MVSMGRAVGGVISAEGPRGLRGGHWPLAGPRPESQARAFCAGVGSVIGLLATSPFPHWQRGSFQSSRGILPPPTGWPGAVQLPDAENVRLSGMLLVRGETQNIPTHKQVGRFASSEFWTWPFLGALAPYTTLLFPSKR